MIQVSLRLDLLRLKRTALFTPDSGLRTRNMVLELSFGKMALDMKASGDSTRLVEKASFGMLMEISMMASGLMTKPMVKVPIHIQMARSILANGRTTSSTAMALRPGKTDPDTKAITRWGRNMDKATTSGKTDQLTKESGTKMT